MKIKIMLVLAIFLAICIGAIVVYVPLHQEKERLAQQASQAQITSQNLKKQIKEMQTQESKAIIEQKKLGLAAAKESITPVEQKQTGSASVKESWVYFTTNVTSLSADESQIDIYLKGEKDTSVDAIDLVLSYPANVTVKEIKKGTVFTAYPRTIDKNRTITITGIAMPQGNSISYGKINEIFVTLILAKQKKATIDLNTTNTQAYLNGTPVLDFTRSFKQIDL